MADVKWWLLAWFPCVLSRPKRMIAVDYLTSLCDLLASRVCYERASLSPTIQTFILSAIWHGVYPGYYLTFLTGVLMTLAARAVSIQNPTAGCARGPLALGEEAAAPSTDGPGAWGPGPQ